MAFIRLFLLLLPTQYEKHFLTEQCENELLTPQKPSSHIVQEIKIAVVSCLIESPTTRQSLQQCGYVNSPENEELSDSVFHFARRCYSGGVQATKRKRSNDARNAAQVSLSFIQSFRREVFNWWSILFECVCQNWYRSQLRSVPRADSSSYRFCWLKNGFWWVNNTLSQNESWS